jgi:hypothetical protein
VLHGGDVSAHDPSTEVALQAWAEARARVRRHRAGLDAKGLAAFERAVAAVHAEFVRRVGQTFTLAELASAWRAADAWAPDVIMDAARPSRPPRPGSLVVDLACGRLERIARDRRPRGLS